MERYFSKEEYLAEVKSRSQLPEGFKTGSSKLFFTPKEKKTGSPYPMKISAVTLDRPTKAFAGVFTRNKFPGTPVIIGKEMLEKEYCRGIFCNNKIANVCAPQGMENSLKILDSYAALAGGAASDYFCASTGIIGWELPAGDICEAIPGLFSSMQSSSLFPLAEAIMTTDNFPKVRRNKSADFTIIGTAKGAGMIEPNMATMFAFILTDADIPRTLLREILPEAVNLTFNRISIDSDQSTSDMTLCLSSSKFKTDTGLFKDSLYKICKSLAEDIVRNGEGTAHVIKLKINGAANDNEALSAGKSVINSPLVKTAIYGNDPNVGRIVMAIGDWAGNSNIALDPGKVKICIGNECVFENGVFSLNPDKEAILVEYLKKTGFGPRSIGYPEHDFTVDIFIDLGMGGGNAEVIGSDLSYEYVRENAEYTS